MDAVLGLSMTPTSVGLVLVEGHDADGATMDRDAFEVREGARHTSEQAAEAVLRTEALAATRGVRLHSIGVTWSEDADAQASALIRSLSDAGFDNVVPIRLPEATEALARGIADVIGYRTTAVCVIEPDTVIALVVNADGPGAVQTAVNHAIDTEESLISWLSSVFTRADWQPEALVVVGSAGGFDDYLPMLEDALSVPVFSPEEAELALARGAALASTSTSSGDLPFADFAAPRRVDEPVGPKRKLSAQTGPLVMLAAGVATFVVSVSVAISLQSSSSEESAPVEPARAVEAPSPAARPAEPPAAPRPVASSVPAAPVLPSPAPAAPPVELAPPPAALPADVGVPAAPVGDNPYVEAPLAPEAAAPPLPGPAMPPEAATPTAPGPLMQPSVPTQEVKKPLHTRILDRIRSIGDDPPPAQYVPAPPPMTPPG